MPLINYNTRVLFDFGALASLPDELKSQQVHRPLVVTDAGIAASPLFGRIEEQLPSAAFFKDAPSNPTEEATEAAATVFADSGCDGIIGFGGGSAMDLAKAVAVRATNPAPLERFAYYNMGMAYSGSTPAPLFLIPTTAGTGSEVSRGAVILFSSGRKALLFLPPGSTKAAILDPELTLGLPPSLTAATGMDAVAHCVETFCSPAVNPPADAIALDGLSRLIANIEKVMADGSDRDARWQMMMGAMEGALAFQKGMGAVHALSHPLGAFGLHHGTLNAVLMPHVLAYNADALAAKLDRLRACVDIDPGIDIPGFFAELNSRLGIPQRLRDMGVKDSDLDGVAVEALHDSSHPTNPRPMTAEDYRKVLEAAW